MSHLLDTNVVSEPRKPYPAPQVVAWLDGQPREDLYLSVLTVGELRAGVAGLERKDPRAARSLDAWVQEVLLDFRDRIVPITAEIADRWGQLVVPDKMQAVDGLLAATALVHGWTLATRNVKDVERSGVTTVNPWEYAAPGAGGR